MKRETVIIAALGILTLAGCNNNHRSQVRKFKQTAEKTNRSCPTRMNETITLDSTRYNEKDNSVSYFYSVTGELDNATYMNTHYAALTSPAECSRQLGGNGRIPEIRYFHPLYLLFGIK